jgi:hypothetical protein
MPRERSTTPQNAGAFWSSREMFRLGILFWAAVALVTVVLAMYGGDDGSNRAPRKVLLAGDGDEVRPPIELDTAVTPWMPPIDELNRLIQDHTPAGRAELVIPAAMKILGPMVRNRSHVQFKWDPKMQDVGGYERVAPEDLADPAKAASFRGRPVEVLGILEERITRSPEFYELDAQKFPLALIEGVVRTDSGVWVRFLEVQEAKKNEYALPLVGRPYKVMGVFYRLVDVDLEQSEVETRPFILATRVVDAIPLRLLETLPDDLAQRIRQIEEVDLTRAPHQDQTFYDLVGYVLKKGKDALHLREGEEPELLRGREPRDDPERFRLRAVRVQGIVVHAQKESFEYEEMRPEDAPLRSYFHLIVADADIDRNVPVSLLVATETLPPDLDAYRRADREERRRLPKLVVDAEGIYYRRHAYESVGDRRGPEIVHLPMVLAVGDIKVWNPSQGESTQTKGFLMAFIVVGVGIVAGLVFMMSRDRRRGHDLDVHLRDTRLKRRKSRGMDLNQVAEQARAEPDQR